MRLRGAAPSLTASLLLLAPFFLRTTLAGTAVNVGLKASWNSAPFLLELLETLADENKTAYFPLLDEIAAGAFAGKNSDKELYDEFLRIAGALGFLASPELRASFNMALSIHAAAPRIEAHYQYYENSLQPRMGKDYDPKCEAWVQWGGKQLCRLEGGELEDMDAGVETERRKLQFDRTGETAEDGPVAVMYADILAPGFAEHHELLRRYAKEGTVSYRLRYKPPVTREERPVILSGYGVSLVLKKTDYVVMDDREVEGGAGKDAVTEGGATAQQPLGTLEDEETDDIKPLQEKDLAGLGYKAASFVMKSESSFETLQKLVQDFPKHSAAIAAVDPDANVTTELQGNWEMVLGPGKNVVWINGLQLEDSQVNAYALLDHLRRERNHIDGFKSLGLNSVDAINLLTHSALTEAKEVQEVQRFDYRDEIEGGNVIVWLNDIEKDERYAEWNANPMSLLRRIYPGQLHPFKRNLHHLVLPVDFTSKEDLELIAKNLRVFVERKIAIRFGLVPLAKTDGATNHAKVFYYLFDTYGLEPAMDYLGKSLEHENFAKPNKKTFESIIKDAKALEGKTALAFDAVLLDKSLDGKISKAKEWSSRMGTNTPVPTIFINGVPILKEDDWTSPMSQKIQEDIVLVQRMVYAHKADDATDFSSLLLDGAAKRRNAHIILENEADIKLVNVPELVRDNKEIFEKLPKVDSDRPDSASETSIWVVGDFDEQDGYDILVGAAELQKEEAGVDLILINNPKATSQKPTMFTLLHQLQQVGFLTPETLQKLLDEINPTNGVSKVPSAEGFMESSVQDVQEKGWSYPDHIESERFWRQSQTILKGVGINPGQKAIIVNGRIIGPIPKDEPFSAADLKQLLEYEHTNRIKPVLAAAKELGIIEKLKSGPLGFAALTNLACLTAISEVPPGLFQSPESTRTNLHEKMLKDEFTSISVGDRNDATFQIVAAIDPASEVAQKWVPILKALSDMSGVHLKIFLNPAKMISELPVKRFYRHVLDAMPSFDEAGRLSSPRARFENIPQEPLLSLSMDVPPSWLVFPKVSVHDLDNLKLSTLNARLRGADVEALYELESILIEGHSRDTNGQPPRGAQLVLGTEKNPHYADTLIMANLGYFQFKANPGLWKIQLKDGMSKTVYTIESIGVNGFLSKREDEDPDIAVLGFQGATLFPRMRRNPGMEEEDVLLPPSKNLKGAVNTAKKWFSGLMGGEVATSKKQADVNIFSVASGHLYERFLGIMMLSVMKNTKHTVKFWFIENFLSPSFKDFLPAMAKEYNFDYELVTYKWPHWLRAQTEKQREIWGYKILFLDVLFPLDLDKVIFVDADQIVRTDLMELNELDLEGAPYGFTPMCDSREEIEGFRFWKQGYWKTFLQGLPYHISALYVVDLVRFRQIAAGDRLRQQYHQLSADKNSLANLDQDLPNHMQTVLPIKSLPQEWLWCETWCSDESLGVAKTIDLCNNPMTKEPKLERARRQVPEWTAYDEEVAGLARRVRGEEVKVGKVEEVKVDELKPVEDVKVEDEKVEGVKVEEVKPVEKVKDEL